MDKMFLYSLLLLAALRGTAQGRSMADHQPADMSMGAVQSPESDSAPPGFHDSQTTDTPSSPPCVCSSSFDLQPLIRDQIQEAKWRGEALALLSQLASSQREVTRLLGTLANQGAQQILDLQNTARHQSLLVENHQALLLQTSRIATQLQDMAKRPAS